MIVFNDMADIQIQAIRMINRGVIVSILNELRHKPGVIINDERIMELDRGTLTLAPQGGPYAPQMWPLRLYAKEIQVAGLLQYPEGVPLNISVWVNMRGVSLRFPVLRRKATYPSLIYGPSAPKVATKYEQIWTENEVNTQIDCVGDTDILYNKLVQGYKRYQSKIRKIDASNIGVQRLALEEQKSMELAGTWGGKREILYRY